MADNQRKRRPKVNDSNKKIGKRVAALRKQNHLTQVALGDLTSTTDKHISEIERGIVGMSIDMQIQLSRVFHCSIDYLIMGEEYQTVETLLPQDTLRILHSGDLQEIATLREYLEVYNKLHKK